MPRKTPPLPHRGGRGRGRFNEAAARCRGKPGTWFPTPPPNRCFNEAAARCRGKPLITTAALIARLTPLQ